jgi:hypothetical protein
MSSLFLASALADSMVAREAVALPPSEEETEAVAALVFVGRDFII